MADTCSSAIFYISEEEHLIEPFCQMRHDKARQMFEEGKCELASNIPHGGWDPARRNWATEEAAQEFIDFVVQTAPAYNVTIVRTAIMDFIQYL